MSAYTEAHAAYGESLPPTGCGYFKPFGRVIISNATCVIVTLRAVTTNPSSSTLFLVVISYTQSSLPGTGGGNLDPLLDCGLADRRFAMIYHDPAPKSNNSWGSTYITPFPPEDNKARYSLSAKKGKPLLIEHFTNRLGYPGVDPRYGSVCTGWA